MTENEILYLASASPRRRALLTQLGLRYERIHAEVNESPYSKEAACAYVERLARAKADAGWEVVQSSDLPVRALLAADTTVVQDGVLFGKPVDEADAYRMLRAFSGRTHQVMTAVAVRREEQTALATSVTEVTFRSLSDGDVQRYVASGEAFDKAGAYGIQGRAAVFVERIAGSFTGVMGLPLFETAALLSRFGYVFP